jgi:peptidoglycan/LPS O-acetylase OafA/YrhL
VVALRKQATAVTVALVVLATQLHGSQNAAALFGTALIISVLAAFWCVVAVSDPREPATLGVRLLVRLAKYTYALYLLQTTAGLAVRWLARSYGVTDASPLTMPLGVLQMALALALAVASYHLLERPFVKLREARSPTP